MALKTYHFIFILPINVIDRPSRTSWTRTFINVVEVYGGHRTHMYSAAAATLLFEIFPCIQGRKHCVDISAKGISVISGLRSWILQSTDAEVESAINVCFVESYSDHQCDNWTQRGDYTCVYGIYLNLIWFPKQKAKLESGYRPWVLRAYCLTDELQFEPGREVEPWSHWAGCRLRLQAHSHPPTSAQTWPQRRICFLFGNKSRSKLFEVSNWYLQKVRSRPIPRTTVIVFNFPMQDPVNSLETYPFSLW